MRTTLTLALLLISTAVQAAVFTAPVVDMHERVTGAATSMAIWSNAKAQVQANAQIKIIFPASFGLGSVDPATCQCIFMKYTSDSAGSFTASEVTVTAGSTYGSTITLQLPGTFFPGPWYVRFDASAGLTNPSLAGFTSLVLEDPGEARMASRSFRILGSLTESDPTQGVISGVITDSSGKPVPGALVVASTAALASVPDLAFGPGLSTAAPRSAGEELLVTISNQSGGYSFTAPYTSTGTAYNVQANYTVRTGTGLLTYQTGTAEVLVNSGNIAITQNLAQQTQISATPLN